MDYKEKEKKDSCCSSSVKHNHILGLETRIKRLSLRIKPLENELNTSCWWKAVTLSSWTTSQTLLSHYHLIIIWKIIIAQVTGVAVHRATLFTVSNKISKTLSMLLCFKSCTDSIHPVHSIHSPPTPQSLCLRTPHMWHRPYYKDRSIALPIKITSLCSTTYPSVFQVRYCYSPPQESTRVWHFLAV